MSAQNYIREGTRLYWARLCKRLPIAAARERVLDLVSELHVASSLEAEYRNRQLGEDIQFARARGRSAQHGDAVGSKRCWACQCLTERPCSQGLLSLTPAMRYLLALV